MWINWNIHTLLWECKTVKPFWKTAEYFLTKLNINLAYSPADALVSVGESWLQALLNNRLSDCAIC